MYRIMANSSHTSFDLFRSLLGTLENTKRISRLNFLKTNLNFRNIENQRYLFDKI